MPLPSHSPELNPKRGSVYADAWRRAVVFNGPLISAPGARLAAGAGYAALVDRACLPRTVIFGIMQKVISGPS